MNIAMAAVDPSECFTCMCKDGPTNTRFHVPGGELLYSSQRDVCFPYLYKVSTHTLVHKLEFLTTILVHIVDTSVDAHIEHAKFANTLLVPLGPHILMKKYSNCFFLDKIQLLTIFYF